MRRLIVVMLLALPILAGCSGGGGEGGGGGYPYHNPPGPRRHTPGLPPDPWKSEAIIIGTGIVLIFGGRKVSVSVRECR